MQLRIHVFVAEEQERKALCSYLRDLGHEVVAADQPKNCALYRGTPCSFEYGCCDVMVLTQHLPEMDALEYLAALSSGCPGKTDNRAIIASLLSPEEILTAIELGCKVLFKPVLEKELESWLIEVVSRTPSERTLTTLH